MTNTLHASLTDILAGLLLWCRATGLSPRTISWYEEKLRRFVVFSAQHGVTTLEACTESFVVQYLLAQPGGPYTRNGHIECIKRLANWAVDQELVTRSRLTRLQKARVAHELRVLTADDVKSFLRACYGPTKLRDQALAMFFYDTGCRFSEARTLRLRDLHLRDGYALVNGKGGKQRLVVFGSRAAQALWKYLQKRRPSQPGIDFVFLGRTGRPITYHVAHQFARIAKRAALERANPHLWRHSMATRELQLGVPTAVVQRILGHAHITTTELYTHLVPDDLRHAYRSPVDDLDL